jgi:hypothetical protein
MRLQFFHHARHIIKGIRIMTDPIEVPVISTGVEGLPCDPLVIITPTVARQIVALAQEAKPAPPASEHGLFDVFDSTRKCPACGDPVLHRYSQSMNAWLPIQYHDCKKPMPTTPTSESDIPTQHQSVPVDEQPAQQGDDAAVEAGPVCVCGEPSRKDVIHRTDGPCYHRETLDDLPPAERATPPADDATVEAMDDAYQPVCSVSVDEMPQHRRGLRAILAAIHRGEVPGVHDGIPRIIGYDDAMREKDAEIATLRARVAELEHPAEPGDDAAVYRLAEAICALRSFNGDENGREAAKAFGVVRDLLDSRNNTITTIRAEVEGLKSKMAYLQERHDKLAAACDTEEADRNLWKSRAEAAEEKLGDAERELAACDDLCAAIDGDTPAECEDIWHATAVKAMQYDAAAADRDRLAAEVEQRLGYIAALKARKVKLPEGLSLSIGGTLERVSGGALMFRSDVESAIRAAGVEVEQ